MRMTLEEYEAVLARREKAKRSKAVVVKETDAPKRSKYGAKKTWRDGLFFDSIKEADYYSELKTRRQCGDIAGYIVHGKMVCTTGGNSSDERAVVYEPDFVVLHNDGSYEIVDTKSEATITPVFKNKMKALKEKFPDVEIHVL